MTDILLQDRERQIEGHNAIEAQARELSGSQATSHDMEIEALFRRAFEAGEPQMAQGGGQSKRMSSPPRRPLNGEPRHELE